MTVKKEFEQPSIENDTMSSKLFTTTNQLFAANQKLQEMQRQRGEMLANISHDLRAPITAIRSAVDYLTSGQNLTPEDYRTSLMLIDRRTATLESLIQDMYYLFCVEDASRPLERQTIDAAQFLEEYYYDALADSRYSRHQLLLDIPEDLNGKITVDIQKIVRVLDNLLGNAVKYSPAGSRILLTAARSAESSCLTVSVRDNGPGIPQEALEHLFERTYTGSPARTPGSATGNGLGLSIVKAIVERHQGQVSCESIEGKGSCFTFTLPFEACGFLR